MLPRKDLRDQMIQNFQAIEGWIGDLKEAKIDPERFCQQIDIFVQEMKDLIKMIPKDLEYSRNVSKLDSDPETKKIVDLFFKNFLFLLENEVAFCSCVGSGKLYNSQKARREFWGNGGWPND